MTAPTSKRCTQLAAQSVLWSCSILMFTCCLESYLGLSLLCVGCWQRYGFTALVGKGLLPHNACSWITYKFLQSSYPHRFSIGLKQRKKQHSKVSGDEDSVLCWWLSSSPSWALHAPLAPTLPLSLWPFVLWLLPTRPASSNSSKPAPDNSSGSIIHPMHKILQVGTLRAFLHWHQGARPDP